MFKKLDPRAIIPSYQTDGAAGFDLHALEFTRLNSQRGVTLVRTGLAVELPYPIEITSDPDYYGVSGYRENLTFHFELQIRPRSGLAIKNFVIIPNSPGTIDCDYRGEIKVPMRIMQGDIWTSSDRDEAMKLPWIYDIQPGDRIAQGIVNMVIKPKIMEVDELTITKRGDGGFGSTGK